MKVLPSFGYGFLLVEGVKSMMGGFTVLVKVRATRSSCVLLNWKTGGQRPVLTNPRMARKQKIRRLLDQTYEAIVCVRAGNY